MRLSRLLERGGEFDGEAILSRARLEYTHQCRTVRPAPPGVLHHNFLSVSFPPDRAGLGLRVLHLRRLVRRPNTGVIALHGLPHTKPG